MSLEGFDLRGPRVRISVVNGPPGLLGEDLMQRLVRFEYQEFPVKDKKHPAMVMEFDNSDGKALNINVPVFGLVLDVSWGYEIPHSRVHRVVLRRIKGNMIRGASTLSPAPNAYGQVVYELSPHNVKQKMHWRPGKDRFSVRGQRVSDIAKQIALFYGFDARKIFIQDTDVAGKRLPTVDEITIETRETAQQFLERWASELGFELKTTNNEFRFHARDFNQQIVGAIQYFKGPDLLEFSFDGDYRAFVSKVTSKSIDPRTGTVATFSDDLQSVVGGGSNLTPFKRNATEDVLREDVFPSVSKKAVVERTKKLASHARARWKVNMKIVGNPYILRQNYVMLGNFGPFIDGAWFVDGVKHTIDGSGYTTDLVMDGRHRAGQEHTIDIPTFSDDGTQLVGGGRYRASVVSRTADIIRKVRTRDTRL